MSSKSNWQSSNQGKGDANGQRKGMPRFIVNFFAVLMIGFGVLGVMKLFKIQYGDDVLAYLKDSLENASNWFTRGAR